MKKLILWMSCICLFAISSFAQNAHVMITDGYTMPANEFQNWDDVWQLYGGKNAIYVGMENFPAKCGPGKISYIRVKKRYKVTAYSTGDFTGDPIVLDGGYYGLEVNFKEKHKDWDNMIRSFKIEYDSPY